MNNIQFEGFIHCVTDKEFVEERKQAFYLEALEGCIIALIDAPCMDLEEAKRKTALVVTRAYINGLISAEESQRVMVFRRKILKERGLK